MHSGNDFDFSKCLLKLLQHFDCGLLFLETIREHVVTFGLILIKCCSHESGLCLSIVMFSISISTQVEFYVFMTCRLDILPWIVTGCCREKHYKPFLFSISSNHNQPRCWFQQPRHQSEICVIQVSCLFIQIVTIQFLSNTNII